MLRDMKRGGPPPQYSSLASIEAAVRWWTGHFGRSRRLIGCSLLDLGRPIHLRRHGGCCLCYDIGILHYASDTPYTQARTLGARGLSYHGMDSTYASTVAIARRILSLEGALDPASSGR